MLNIAVKLKLKNMKEIKNKKDQLIKFIESIPDDHYIEFVYKTNVKQKDCYVDDYGNLEYELDGSFELTITGSSFE